MNGKTLPELLGDKGIFVDGDWVESKDQDPDGEVRLIQLADVGEAEFLNKSQRFLTHEKARELGCTFLEAGDILIARMPDPIGRACIFPGLAQPCVTVVDVAIARLASQTDRRWLMRAINAPPARLQMSKFLNGTTRTRISRSNLAQIRFADTKPKDQERIADILDEADALRRKRREALALTDELLRATFLEMFGDPVANPKGWSKDALGDNIDILPGWSADGEPRPASEDELGVLKVSAVSSGRFLKHENKAVDRKSTITRALVHPKRGDLLFSRANTRELVAAVCLVEEDCPNVFLPDKLWRITPTNSRLSNEYLRFVLGSPSIHYEIAKTASGTSGSMLNVSQDKVRSVRIPFAPETMQQAFARFVWATLDSQRRAATSDQHLDALFASLQHRAFRGEL